MRSRTRAGLLATALLTLAPVVLGAAAGEAMAQPAPARPVLVVAGDGVSAQRLAAEIGKTLPDPWTSGDDAAFARALAGAGQKPGSIGPSLGSPGGRAALAKKASGVAASTGTSAVLLIRVSPIKNARVVRALLVTPEGGGPELDTTVTVGAGDADALRAALLPVLARLAAPRSSAGPGAAPPPSPGAPPAGPGASPAAPASPSADGAPAAEPEQKLAGAAGAMLILSFGGGYGARVVRYNDGLSRNLLPYDLPASANLAITAEVYPFARLSVPVLRNLGLAGGFQLAPGLRSQTSTGASITSSWMRADGALRLRFAFGDEARFILGLGGGIAKERFVFGKSALSPSLPDVDYLFWRLAVDGRLRAGPMALLASAAFLPAIDGGQLADRFRQAGFSAVEVGFGLAIPVNEFFEARATGTYTRVFYSFDPKPGDAYVAGGALDQIVRAQIFATLLL